MARLPAPLAAILLTILPWGGWAQRQATVRLDWVNTPLEIRDKVDNTQDFEVIANYRAMEVVAESPIVHINRVS
jgi:predicted RNA polymerase sigma factor